MQSWQTDCRICCLANRAPQSGRVKCKRVLSASANIGCHLFPVLLLHTKHSVCFRYVRGNYGVINGCQRAVQGAGSLTQSTDGVQTRLRNKKNFRGAAQVWRPAKFLSVTINLHLSPQRRGEGKKTCCLGTERNHPNFSWSIWSYLPWCA